MTTYQPWMTSLIDMVRHNSAVMVWFSNRISQQYHSQSDHLVVTLTCFALALSQLAAQVFDLLHLIGEVLN